MTDQSVTQPVTEGPLIMTTAAHTKPGRPTSAAIRARREEQILEAAAKLFAQHGYAEMATQALADTLGVGKGTIYRYFPSKEALFLAAVDRAMRQLHLAIDARISGVQDPWQRMALGVACCSRRSGMSGQVGASSSSSAGAT